MRKVAHVLALVLGVEHQEITQAGTDAGRTLFSAVYIKYVTGNDSVI